MLADFHVETEDESPREVSKELVALHNELLTGNSNTIERLQQAMPIAVSTSKQETVSNTPLSSAIFLQLDVIALTFYTVENLDRLCFELTNPPFRVWSNLFASPCKCNYSNLSVTGGLDLLVKSNKFCSQWNFAASVNTKVPL